MAGIFWKNDFLITVSKKAGLPIGITCFFAWFKKNFFLFSQTTLSKMLFEIKNFRLL